MSKMRVYELAQEMGRQNKEVMEFLKSKGVDVKSHMSNVEEEYVHMTKEKMGNNSEEPKKADNGVKEPTQENGAPKKKKISSVFFTHRMQVTMEKNGMRKETDVRETEKVQDHSHQV